VLLLDEEGGIDDTPLVVAGRGVIMDEGIAGHAHSEAAHNVVICAHLATHLQGRELLLRMLRLHCSCAGARLGVA